MSRNRRKDRALQACATMWRHRKIHIRDLVLTADMHGAGQRFRFNVELTVAEDPRRPVSDNIANVISYADIVDGIRAIVARRQARTPKSLAEDVARIVLEDERAVRVRVAVDLLDPGPEAAAAGVELVRARAVQSSGKSDSGKTAPWVVKLGGSLSRSPRLGEWLNALAASHLPLAVVPGGGTFADQVRESQARWRFDEAAAHHMALLAMDQMGRMFAALESSLRMCSCIEDFIAAYANGEAAVWLPSAMTLSQDGIEESWDVTSDSLAAWLAGRLGASGLLLVKSVEPQAADVDAAELARSGLVDREFPRYLADSGVEAWCVGPDDAERTVGTLAEGKISGCRILARRQSCQDR